MNGTKAAFLVLPLDGFVDWQHARLKPPFIALSLVVLSTFFIEATKYFFTDALREREPIVAKRGAPVFQV
ncbi:hypothetical protein [Corynebacterium uterequi]|uniref:Uncharacterized protein n=1 Tax=Corynebacterium uterequi TaxID=1072256 RepID=A0A0G3HCF3_9CORY|nr:hypothetical protein [Corynebacterium uterequi]AKK10984.1 hypothetical protein CUTER_04910 [Corynebacterium uterequi]